MHKIADTTVYTLTEPTVQVGSSGTILLSNLFQRPEMPYRKTALQAHLQSAGKQQHKRKGSLPKSSENLMQKIEGSQRNQAYLTFQNRHYPPTILTDYTKVQTKQELNQQRP